jgi:hypothetical protein
MSYLRHLLVADLPGTEPLRDETVIWVGPAEPPPTLAHRRAIVRARTSAEAAALISSAPALLRLALSQPLGFLEALADAEQITDARAA